MPDRNKLSLVIFDCDGVLVDSEKYSCGAWNVLFEEMFHIEVGSNYDEILGKSDRSAVEHYASLHPEVSNWLEGGDREIRIQKLAQQKLQMYYKIAEGNLQAVQGVKDVIMEARGMGLPIVVGSSGTHEKIRWNLKQAGLDGLFDDITSSTDVSRGKPFPDLFMEAARKMRVPSDQALVIEDSMMGLQAARSAGCFSVGITTTFPREKLEPIADQVVESFHELNLSQLKASMIESME